MTLFQLRKPIITCALMLLVFGIALDDLGHAHVAAGVVYALLGVALFAVVTRQLTVLDRDVRAAVARHPAGKALDYDA